MLYFPCGMVRRRNCGGDFFASVGICCSLWGEKIASVAKLQRRSDAEPEAVVTVGYRGVVYTYYDSSVAIQVYCSLFY